MVQAGLATEADRKTGRVQAYATPGPSQVGHKPQLTPPRRRRQLSGPGTPGFQCPPQLLPNCSISRAGNCGPSSYHGSIVLARSN